MQIHIKYIPQYIKIVCIIQIFLLLQHFIISLYSLTILILLLVSFTYHCYHNL